MGPIRANTMASSTIKTVFCTSLLAAGAVLVTASHAADAVYQDDVAPVPQEMFSRSILIGGGAGLEPLYEGSDEYRVFPLPIISYDSSGEPGPRGGSSSARWTTSASTRCASIVSRSVRLRATAFGRDESDSARLRGLRRHR